MKRDDESGISAYLVVKAVGAGYELAVGGGSWEPGFKVVLFGGSIVQLPRHDVDHPVGQAQALVEFLGVGDHLLKHLPGGVAMRAHNRKLLHLLKLVHPVGEGNRVSDQGLD